MENLFSKKNPLHDLLSSLNAVISTNESTRIMTGHVIYNPAYTYLQISTENHLSMPLVHQKLSGVTVHVAQPLTLNLSYSECEFVCLFVTYCFFREKTIWLVRY